MRVPNEHTEAVMKFFATHLQESGAELKLTKVDEVDGVFRVNLTLITGEDLADLLCANGHASRGTSNLCLDWVLFPHGHYLEFYYRFSGFFIGEC